MKDKNWESRKCKSDQQNQKKDYSEELKICSFSLFPRVCIQVPDKQADEGDVIPSLMRVSESDILVPNYITEGGKQQISLVHHAQTFKLLGHFSYTWYYSPWDMRCTFNLFSWSPPLLLSWNARECISLLPRVCTRHFMLLLLSLCCKFSRILFVLAFVSL